MLLDLDMKLIEFDLHMFNIDISPSSDNASFKLKRDIITNAKA